MENYKELAKYEIEKANCALREAQILYDAEGYSGAANRSYYAVFHAMSALLATDERKYSTHGGVISRFREYYVKTGLFDKSLSDKIGDLFMIRTLSDYDAFYVVAKSDVSEQIDNAKSVLSAIENIVNDRIGITQEADKTEEYVRDDDLLDLTEKHNDRS